MATKHTHDVPVHTAKKKAVKKKSANKNVKNGGKK